MMDIQRILEENNVILKGHFLLSSGLHSDIYFEKFRLLEKPSLLYKIITTREKELRELDVNLCVGPLTGGAFVAFAIALILDIKAYYMEKEQNDLVLRRDISIGEHHHILLCDDVLTTGSSFQKMLKGLGQNACKVKGYFVLIDRSAEVFDDTKPILSIYKSKQATYKPDECPLCKMGVPLQTRGSTTTL